MNALYNCCIANPWLDVVEKLDRELNIKPKYYIGWNDGSETIKERYEECFYQVIEDAWNGKGFPTLEYKYALDETLLKSIAHEELIALKMMDRLDLDRYSFSLSDRQSYFYYLLKHWLVILDTYHITLVISPSIPHRVFDYVLYIAAKIKGIEFVMFQMTPFGDSSFIIDSVDTTTKYFKEYIAKTPTPKHPIRKDISERIEQAKGDYHSAIPEYMKRQERMIQKQNHIMHKIITFYSKLIHTNFHLFKENPTYHIDQSSMPYDKKALKYFMSIKGYKNRRYLKNLKHRYQSLTRENGATKYVLLALHYQPEETSSPTGGAYVNQELIAELLNDFLPKDIMIIIKEHKTQFHPVYEGATGRSSNFYDYVLNISDRIQFVSLESDPFELMKHAIATVTISGTIGWESAIRGTPTLLFGRAWYEDMAGVFKIKSKNDLHENWDMILQSKNNIDEEDILNYHKKIEQFFINAPHYKKFVGKVKRSHEENISNVVTGIENHLKIKEIL